MGGRTGCHWVWPRVRAAVRRVRSRSGGIWRNGTRRVWVGDKDSLTLNIWRASGPPSPRPVIIWIHGGANWLETSRCTCCDGTEIARLGTIFVSLNYRVGIFGFLDLSPIGGPPEAHSDGLTDQMAAINWVVDNIAAFGGDRGNITLMGNSAGSIDISWHIASGRLPKGVRRVVSPAGSPPLPDWDGTGQLAPITPSKGTGVQLIS